MGSGFLDNNKLYGMLESTFLITMLKYMRLELADLRKAINIKARELENLRSANNPDVYNLKSLTMLSNKIYETILNIMHHENKNQYNEFEVSDYLDALEKFKKQTEEYLTIHPNSEAIHKRISEQDFSQPEENRRGSKKIG